MKINFDDGGYVMFSISPKNTIYITIAATHKDNPQDTIINSGEITKKQLLELVESVSDQNINKKDIGSEDEPQNGSEEQTNNGE